MTEKRFENRLNKSNVKFNTLNPVWDNEKENALNVFEMIDELNKINKDCDNLINDNTEYVAEINQIHKENLDLSEELDYYKAKCASLETGLFQVERETEELRKENKKLKLINNQLEDRLEESGIGIALKMEDLND